MISNHLPQGIGNPISLARLIRDASIKPLSLCRVSPNILVGIGAKRFAEEHGMLSVANELLVSKNAKYRFVQWYQDLVDAETKTNTAPCADGDSRPQPSSQYGNAFRPEVTPTASGPQNHTPPGFLSANHSAEPNALYPMRPQADAWTGEGSSTAPYVLETNEHSHTVTIAHGNSTAVDSLLDSRDSYPEAKPLRGHPNSNAGHAWGNDSAGFRELQDEKPDVDMVDDTVGAIAIDLMGHIAAGSSSGGIGMKHEGRVGPAALVGIGTAVIPVDPGDDDGVSVAAVTSGTGEHMATSFASHKCAERLYHSSRRGRGGQNIAEFDDDAVVESFITVDFMGHPGVKSQPTPGAIGVMAVKQTNSGYYFYFAHNTESFALASMASTEPSPLCTMSRTGKTGGVIRGGRKIHIN